MNHRTARLIAGRTNGIGRRLGCSCCNMPRNLFPDFSGRVRTRIKRAGVEEIVEALTPDDPSDYDCNCPDCVGIVGDVDPITTAADGDRWRFAA